MNRFLLSCAAIALTASMASAETVTFDFVNETYGQERQSGSSQTYIADGGQLVNEPVTITVTKGSGNGCRLWADGLRMMKGDFTLTFEAAGATITNIDFTGVKAAAVSALSAEEGEYTADGTSGVWTGASTAVVITSAPTATQCLSGVTVTYTTGAGDLQPAGLKFEETSFDYDLSDGEFNAPELINPNNLPVTWTSSDEAVATVDAEGHVNIFAAGTTTITAASEATDEFLAGKASYTIKVTEIIPLRYMWQLEDIVEEGYTLFRFGFQTQVAYKNGLYNYITDTSGYEYTLLYGSTDYVAGDIIPVGWVGEYTEYYGLPEIKPYSELPAASTNQDVLAVYTTVRASSLNESLVNHIIYIDDVELPEALTGTAANLTCETPEGDIVVRNTFKLDGIEPGTYKMKAAVGIYNDTIQLYPIAFEGATGINAIEAENAAVYYDLNGRQINGALQQGLYIKVVNGQATKHLVK